MEPCKPVDRTVSDPDVGDVVLCVDYAAAHLDGLLDPREYTAHEVNLVRWGLVLTYFRNHEEN